MLTALSLGLALVCLLVSLIPMLPFPHGMIRMFDFGRLQVIAFALLAMGLALAAGGLGGYELLALATAAVALAIQLAHVLRFTPLWFRQTQTFKGDADAATTISLLACNVKQGNRQYERVTSLLADCDPDLAVFMETDDGWADALRPHFKHCAEVIEQPQPNTYGMILASRHPLRDSTVNFLLNEEVPSISCEVMLPGNRPVRVVALHPEPPLPTRDTLGRDAEILLVAEKARDEELPTIVTGDLNDVAWSRTTRRFLRISRLLDPRQGRGMFNSFDARYWFLRWPLDHIFHSRDFELVNMKRMPSVGSDHFPMFYTLALGMDERNTAPEQPSKEDIHEADEAVRIEKARDRPPAGTDWEE